MVKLVVSLYGITQPTLSAYMKELASEFESDVEQQTTIITKLLSPLLLLGMAVIVFLLFMATFIPLTQMYTQAGG